VLSADGKSVFVADLGLDQILSYKVGGLTPNDPPFIKIAPGVGPRHLAFTPNGKFAYVMTEMTASVVAFKHAGGKFEELQTLPTTEMAPNVSGAEIAVHPSGKFVYSSTRGANLIDVFAIDAAKGTLTPVERTPSGGKTPRNFAIDPTGAFLLAAHQDSDNVVVFRIDAKTGKLTPTGDVLEAGAQLMHLVDFLHAPAIRIVGSKQRVVELAAGAHPEAGRRHELRVRRNRKASRSDEPRKALRERPPADFGLSVQGCHLRIGGSAPKNRQLKPARQAARLAGRSFFTCYRPPC